MIKYNKILNYYIGGFYDTYFKMSIQEAIVRGMLFFTDDDRFYFKLHENSRLTRCYLRKTKKVFDKRLPYLSYETHI